MIDQTSCWDCSAVYPMSMDRCPQCGAINGNADYKAAMTQMIQREQDRRRESSAEKGAA